ncbi:MAG TPA: OmpA family protein [Flavobacteriaceae bacterium]|nr:OmpA family protein [Flavobacteriaceae bacterium]
MKHLSRFLAAFVFLFSLTAVQAQDENNPWALSIGVNAVDFYPTGTGTGAGSMAGESIFDEAFNYEDHWNILPSISRISVGRYIGSGFVGELAGTINRIDKIGDVGVDDLSYYSVDLTVKYSLNQLYNAPDSWFDPYLGVGGSYVWLDDENSITYNGTAGINFWAADQIAINLQTSVKNTSDDSEINSHFQHSLGVTFTFGGKDTDGDGIYDDEDKCPETPGLAEFDGCPDTDGDGIQDSQDDCPNKAGLAEFNGCPDTDGDGVADPDDECPTVAGLKEMNGCPDADGDGVKDSEDECPDEAGPAENNGCPFEDRDNDGVLDKDDQCPDVAGTTANNGCPEVTVEVINQLNEYSKTILFDLNKASIRKESYDALDAIVEIMKEYPSADFHIAGHTDSSGSAAYNEKLSRERAASVRSYLVTHGIEAGQITSEGYGEKYPIATNKTAAGRQQNRRVEVTLEKNKPGMSDASDEG